MEKARVQKRNGELDFLKLIFSIIIVSFHSGNFIQSENGYFKGGSIAVDFFFIVSGAMMARNAAQKAYEENLGIDTFEFMKKKILRFMPNIYVAWAIAFVVKHWHCISWKQVMKDFFSSIWELLFLTNTGTVGYLSNGATWYISAMILIMLLLWPLIRKYKENFFYIIAPLMILFLLGYSYQNFPSLKRPMKWQGLCLRSMIRGTMEICMGCLSFRMAEFMKKTSFTNVAKTLLFAISWLGYGGVIWYSYSHTGSKADWILLMILWLSVTITCSEKSIVMPLFSHKLFSWFGSFSFSLYLGHGFWAKEMRNLFPQMGEGRMLILYVILAVVTGLFIQYTSLGLRKFWKVKGEAVKRIFIE